MQIARPGQRPEKEIKKREKVAAVDFFTIHLEGKAWACLDLCPGVWPRPPTSPRPELPMPLRSSCQSAWSAVVQLCGEMAVRQEDTVGCVPKKKRISFIQTCQPDSALSEGVGWQSWQTNDFDCQSYHQHQWKRSR